MLVSFAGGRRRWLGLAMALALLATAGCGAGKQPVQGKVVFRDGTPCTRGMVVFEPVDPEAVTTSSRGFIEKDGSFVMATEDADDGVPEGEYQVMVIPLIGVQGQSGPPINLKYSTPTTSPLKYKVVAGKNDVTFTMDPADARQPRIIDE